MLSARFGVPMGIRNYADFIRVPVLLGKRQWLIELSLATARRGMKYAMLLERQAMANRLIVNPGKSHFLFGSNFPA